MMWLSWPRSLPDFPGSDCAAEFAGEHLQFLAASHEVLQFLDGDRAFLEGAERLASVENRKAIANCEGVADIVCDENYTQAFLPHLMNVLQNHRGLGDAKRRRRLVEDQDLGPEVDGPRNCHALPLASRKRADGLARVTNINAYLAHFLSGHPIAVTLRAVA